MPERIAQSNPANDKRNKTMALMRANGDTYEEIGNAVGLSKAQAYNVLSRKEAKEIIERESNRLMEALPDITSNSITQIRTASNIHNAIRDNSALPGTFTKQIPTKEGSETVPDVQLAIKYAELAAKREKDILQAMGILATPNQSTVIQNIYNDNRQVNLDQSVIKALGSFLQPTTPQDCRIGDIKTNPDPIDIPIANDAIEDNTDTKGATSYSKGGAANPCGTDSQGITETMRNGVVHCRTDNQGKTPRTDNGGNGGNIYSAPTHTIDADFEEIQELGGNGADSSSP